MIEDFRKEVGRKEGRKDVRKEGRKERRDKGKMVDRKEGKSWGWGVKY